MPGPVSDSYDPEFSTASARHAVLEQVRCAEINLDNLTRSAPGMADHPYYKMARFQLCQARHELGDIRANDESLKWIES